MLYPENGSLIVKFSVLAQGIAKLDGMSLRDGSSILVSYFG